MQTEKIEKIIYFLKNNKLLVFVLTLAFVLLLILLFNTGVSTQDNLDSRSYYNSGDYIPISESTDFIFYKDANGYHVFVSDPNKTNKELIRRTLNIPENFEFDIVLPNAFSRETVQLDNENLVTPEPVDIDNPEGN